MGKKLVNTLDEDNLLFTIDEMREVLNKMCCNLGDQKMSSENLIVSQQLDKLISDYMMLIKNKQKKREPEILEPSSI
jgi:hypothetical protein